MKRKTAANTAARAAGKGFLLTAIIAPVVLQLLPGPDDWYFGIAVSIVVLAPLGAVVGAIAGAIYGMMVHERSRHGLTDRETDKDEKSFAGTVPAVISAAGRNLLRTVTVILAAIAGAAALLILWFWLSANFLTWIAHLFGGDHMPGVMIYLDLDLTLGTVLWFIMPPISAGLGALAGAKLVLRYWPDRPATRS
ncbi:MAG: hypothetical protein C0605_07140 [Hyphomicrobiales bacterium]|nr:MAG: hypothetical protein C0605_07140 [Hyphomicrobiales bacterium]